MAIKFTIDSREPAEMLAIFKTLNIPFERKMMEAGDYMTDRVIFERKTTADFSQSIQSRAADDARIFDQIDRVLEFAENHNLVPWLVISGDFEDLQETLKRRGIELNVNAIFGAVASISVRYYGVNIIWNLRGSAELVYTIYKIAEKVAEGKLYMPRQPTLKRVHQNRRVAHICQIARVSPNIGEKLLERFGNITGVLLAPLPELEKIPGVGPLTSRRIKSLLG